VIEFEAPRDLGGEMRDYQLQGLSWLISCYDNGIGAFLGDEMVRTKCFRHGMPSRRAEAQPRCGVVVVWMQGLGKTLLPQVRAQGDGPVAGHLPPQRPLQLGRRAQALVPHPPGCVQKGVMLVFEGLIPGRVTDGPLSRLSCGRVSCLMAPSRPPIEAIMRRGRSFRTGSGPSTRGPAHWCFRIVE
jgi:hypothetical protein